MRAASYLSAAYSFLCLHRLVVLIICVVVLGSVFSIYILARGRTVEPVLDSPPRIAVKVIWPEGLPPRTLKPWGTDPFRDVLKEMEAARKKAAKAAAAKAAAKVERIAREEVTTAMAKANQLATRKEYKEALAALDSVIAKYRGTQSPLLEQARVLHAQIKTGWEEAEKAGKAARKLAAEQARQRERRKKVILSLRVEGIGSGVKPDESFVIIEGKSYSVGDTVEKDGVKAVIESIRSNGVDFRDPESGDIYSVLLSR
jgi:hypothetical protein